MRLVFAFSVILLLVSPSVFAQQPEYLGSILSDTANSHFGSVIVPLGDQSGDGYSDILIQDDRWVGQVFGGSTTVSGAALLRFEKLQAILGRPGLVNQDSYRDILVPPLASEPNRAKLFLGGPSLDTVVDFAFGVDSLSGQHLKLVLSHDVNESGSDEIITQLASGLSRSIVIYELGIPWDSVPDQVFGPSTLLQPFASIADEITTGDFNGDGSPDFAVNWRPLEDTVSGAALLYYGGSGYDTVPDLIIRRPSGPFSNIQNFAYQVLLCPGDLNGDSYDDLIIGSSLAYGDTLTFVYYGGPDIDTIPDVTIFEEIDFVAQAGDINHDGYADFLAGRPIPFGGYVTLYYGGPDFDNHYDFKLWSIDIPGAPLQFPLAIAGIGDYNGDGIDDFAVSGVEIQSGEVYIYTGVQDPTDVPYDYEPALPTGYELSQNYPNPFNPTTTISFALPLAGATELTVYNVLGEKVKTLIDRQLSAGSYTIEWDGTNATGDAVASGVYVYRLRSGEFVTSRKMILVR